MATCHDNTILDNIKHRKSNQISYKWEESNKEMYVKNITSIHSKNQVANLSELLRCGTNTNLLEQGAVILNRIILEAAESCKMSHRNTEHKKDRILSTPHNKQLASPWYDDECHKLRKDYNKLRNLYNRTSNDSDKVKKKEAHNLYKCICQRKSKAHKMEQTEQMIITKRKDPKSYWKCFKVYKPHQEDIVTLEAFRKHFSELCAWRGLEIPAMHKLYNNCVPELDDKFTLSEIESAISHLKGGKSAGDDHIISEFLSCGKNKLKHVLVLLFNNLYEEGYFPEEWATGIIVPIYRKGDRSLPTNYRGITLTSTMSKLFTHILNQRLLQWSEQYHISCQAQFAYKPGYSTTDAVFVLHSVIAQTVKESDAVCCFIDFSKAFDHVERNILFKKMIKYGVSSKMLKMIENMYSKMKTRVRSTEECTNSFLLENGLMQGECLSPSLF